MWGGTRRFRLDVQLGAGRIGVAMVTVLLPQGALREQEECEPRPVTTLVGGRQPISTELTRPSSVPAASSSSNLETSRSVIALEATWIVGARPPNLPGLVQGRQTR